MALYEDEDQIDQPPVIKQPVLIEKPSVRSNVVDTRYEPKRNLLAYIEGSPMTVDYYSQVLASDTELSPQQSSLPGPFQQYRLIKRFELRVTDPFSSSQNVDEKTMELHGSANVYPCLMPNEGDVFVADIGDGRAALFQVLTSEKKSAYKEAIFAISYVSTKFFTDTTAAELESKTVERLNFVRDFMVYGRNPFITDEENRAISDISKFYSLSVGSYIADFMYKETNSLLAPDPKLRLYDHFMSQFIAGLITVVDAHQSQEVVVLNCDGSRRMKTPTLFDAIAVRSKEYLSRCVWRVGISNPATFNRIPRLNGIYYCAVDGVVVPVTVGTRVIDPDNGQGLPGPYAFSRDDDFYTGMLDEVDGTQTPLVKSVLVDDHYILSAAFYSNDRQNMSVLERLIMDYIEEKQPQNTQLAMLVIDSHKWGRMEQFYYLPLLYALIKATLHGL